MDAKNHRLIIDNLYRFFREQKRVAALEGRDVDYVGVIKQYRSCNTIDDSDVMKFLFERLCSFIRNYRFENGDSEKFMEILEMNESCCPGSHRYTCCDCCNAPTAKQLVSFNNIINAIPGNDYFQERQEIIKAYENLFPQ